MQHLNNDFNKFKVDDSTHVNMFIIQKMWKKSFNYASIIIKYCVACVLGYYNNCNMQFVSNGFNILKVNSSTDVHMFIIEETWKKSLIHSNINVGFLIVICFNKLW
jgi:ubiquitin-protein ligase